MALHGFDMDRDCILINLIADLTKKERGAAPTERQLQSLLRDANDEHAKRTGRYLFDRPFYPSGPDGYIMRASYSDISELCGLGVDLDWLRAFVFDSDAWERPWNDDWRPLEIYAATYAVNRCLEENSSINVNALQAVLWFADAYFVDTNGTRLLFEPFEPGVLGPRLSSVACRFGCHGVMDICSHYKMGTTSFGEDRESVIRSAIDEILPHCLSIAEVSTWDLLNRTRIPNGSWNEACERGEKYIDGPTSDDLGPLFEGDIAPDPKR